MEAKDLKKEVLDRIAGIDDQAFLEVIKSLLNYQETDPVMMLPPDLRKRLLSVMEKSEAGSYITEEEIDAQVETWLREK